MKVMIFDPRFTGHRCEYLRRIIPAVQSLGVELVVVFPENGFRSDEFAIHLKDIESSVQWRVCSDLPQGNNFKIRWSIASQLRRFIDQERPEHLYVPWGDIVSQVSRFYPVFPQRSHLVAEGLHFSGAFGYPATSLKQRLKTWFTGRLFAKAPWSVFSHLDPWQLESLRERFPELRNRSMVMPDPVDPPTDISRQAAREELGLPLDGNYIGCAGPMTGRKGYHLLLDAFASAISRLPSDAKLLLAGKFSVEGWRAMASKYGHLLRSGRIVAIDRFLSTREMDIVIPAMDVVCVPYPDHSGSSGIALRAMANRRPILASDRYWLKKMVETFQIGWTCDVTDRNAFVESLVNVFQNYGPHQRIDSVDRYLKFQSEENFLATWTARLRQRLGLLPNPGQLGWDWVVSPQST